MQEPTDILAEIQTMIDQNPVILFMKGTKEAPLCGFSATVCQILNAHQVPYLSVNVLANPALREGIKAFSDWPTIPQLYVRGEFVGGCDIVREMEEAGELATMLNAK